MQLPTLLGIWQIGLMSERIMLDPREVSENGFVD